MYANTRILYEVWQQLPSLTERVALGFLGPELHEASGVPSVIPEEKAFPERAWRRPANASNTIIKSAGHLITHEALEQVARKIKLFVRHVASKTQGVAGKARL